MSIGTFWEYCSMKTNLHRKKNSKYLSTYCFANLSVKLSLHTASHIIYIYDATLSRQSWLHWMFGQLLLPLLRLVCTTRLNHYQGYVVLLLVTTLSKFQIFVTIVSHSATPINGVCFEPLTPSCQHGVDSTFQLAVPHEFRFLYTWTRSVRTWGNSFLFQFCGFTILMNLM